MMWSVIDREGEQTVERFASWQKAWDFLNADAYRLELRDAGSTNPMLRLYWHAEILCEARYESIYFKDLLADVLAHRESRRYRYSIEHE